MTSTQSLIPQLASDRIPAIGIGRPVLGIDPSLTNLAICLAQPGQPLLERTFKSKPADTMRERIERYKGLIVPVLRIVQRYEPAVILIEGYAYNKREGRGIRDTAEFGGLLRWKLLQHARVAEVPPTTLKKFATGKGSGSKAPVISALAARYGRTFQTDDEADAYALAKLAMCVTAASAPETKAQRETTLLVLDLLKEAA